MKTTAWKAVVTRAVGLLAAGLPLMALRSDGTDIPYCRIDAMERTPVIDGVITKGEWPDQSLVRLSRGYHAQHGIRLYFAFDDSCLYVGAYVEDEQLWADGNGGGTGNAWEHRNDDAIEWFFDPDNSRDSALMPNDRFLGLNIGFPGGPVNGPGIVSRYSWNQGDGLGGTPGVPGGMAPGLVYAVHHDGTVNNPADVDAGYSMEVAVPWSALRMAPPADGQCIGVNAVIFFDQAGGLWDTTYNRFVEPKSLRFTRSLFPDEFVELRGSTRTPTMGGILGPVDYVRLQFHRNADATPPGPVSSLSADDARPYSVRLNWMWPGGNGNQGLCAGLDIRYATAALTAANATAAKRWPARLAPAPAGTAASTRVMGLAPGSNYWFAVRAFDLADNLGEWRVTGPVRTPTTAQFGIRVAPAVYKGAVRVAPGGRYFMTENGANFVPVGHHFALGDMVIRYIYPADVWNSYVTPPQFVNFSLTPGAMATVTNHLTKLAANGVTVMRIWLEEFYSPVQNDGNFSAANGAYWLEFPRGNYNPAMSQLMNTLLRLCAERGIYVLVVPISTYDYERCFTRTCWYSGNGGPLTDIHQFWHSPEALQMCKDRWAWVIGQIKAGGYEDAVFGYDVLNEWDGFLYGTDQDGAGHAAFTEALAQYVRSLDGEHLVMSSNGIFDPRGPHGALSLYKDVFDGSLPHMYLPASEVPDANPFPFKGTAIFQQHSELTAWWTLNQLSRRPVLDSEWMPCALSPYTASFTEQDDNLITRVLWFTELCSGAAGAGLRLPGKVRDPNLQLTDTMLGLQRTISAFVENGSKNPSFDFRDFPSENWRGQISVAAPGSAVLVTGCSDGRKGLAYLLQDKNVTSATVSGATLTVDNLLTAGAQYKAEFWRPLPNQQSPAAVVSGTISGRSVNFAVPAFTDDWAVRFYVSNGAAGVPVSRIRIPFIHNNWVWWNVLDGVSGQWVNPPGSGYLYAPREIVATGLKEYRWYWIGVFDAVSGSWLMSQWVGTF